MSAFDKTLWADDTFSKDYRENADYYIQQRAELFRVLRSFFKRFVGLKSKVSVCDIGCGDGVLCEQLFQEDASIRPTLVDGSNEMLAAAKKRLSNHPECKFVQMPFSDLGSLSTEGTDYGLIVSAFAIHHLSLPEKAALFQTVYNLLAEGGWFLNIDTVYPDDSIFTDWYYEHWQAWVDERDRAFKLKGAFKEISQRARANPDNKLSPLAVQLELLRAAGFQSVDCHYKNGLFAVFGGQRRTAKSML